MGRALRKLREEKELTQEGVAQQAKITTRVLRGIEKGQGNPTWATVVALLGALGISLSELAEAIEHQRG